MDPTHISETKPPVTVDIGDRLGPYKLTSILGAGGMGTVFVGEHDLIGRRVALKVLHPAFALDPEIARRFMLEARLANQIASESVVEVEDFVRTPEGLCYLVMELLEGADLASTVAAEGILPIARTLPIIRQVAEALSAAHKAHIVHRDLKPENIFLVQRADRHDLVKLLDFGIAKLSETRSGRQLTQIGAVLGTPAFMSPEQASGLVIDHRTDIYALGIVLYWLLSGKLPFEGDSLESQRASRQAPAPSLPPATPSGEPIPEPLSRLAADCLAQDATARPPAMKTVIERIDALSKKPDPPLPPPRSRLLQRPALGVAVLAAIAAVATGAWLFTRHGPAEPSVPGAPAPVAAPTTTPSPTLIARPSVAPPLAPVPTLAQPPVPTVAAARTAAAAAAPTKAPPALSPVPTLAGAPGPTPAPRAAKTAAAAHPPSHRAPGPGQPSPPAASESDPFAPLPDPKAP